MAGSMSKELTIDDLLKRLHSRSRGHGCVAVKSPIDAWNNCAEGDSMMRFARKLGVDLKILTLAKVRHARLAEHLIKDKDSIRALDVAQRFANGIATKEELDRAARLAYSKANANFFHDDAPAAFANYAAAYAADYDAVDSAASAADANAANANDTIYDPNAHPDPYLAFYACAARSPKRMEILAKCAEICREIIPFELLDLENYC